MLINISTQARIWEQDFFAMFPQVSFPSVLTDAILAPYSFATLTYPAMPTPGEGQVVADTGQAQVDGVWTVTYALEAMTADQLAAAQAQLQAQYTAAAQNLLDTTAKSKGYDSMLALASYQDDPNPTFAAEAAAGKAWRSAVWTATNALLAAIKAGTTPAPTEAAFLDSLPAMVWPLS
jgi:hypothetical protein